jgi:hypothetical protein
VLQSGSSLLKSKRQLILIGVCLRFSLRSLGFRGSATLNISIHSLLSCMHATQCYLPLPMCLSVSNLISLLQIQDAMCLSVSNLISLLPNPLRPHLFPCARLLPRMTTQCLHQWHAYEHMSVSRDACSARSTVPWTRFYTT